MSSTVPQTHQYRLLVLAGVSQGLKSQKDTISTLTLKVFPVHQPTLWDPCKDTKCPGTHHMQTHICSIHAHMCDKATRRMCVCVCRVLSTLELHTREDLFIYQAWRCPWRNATSGLGVGLTSLSVCGEPEFALGFLIFIQECQFPLLSTLESITTSWCLPTYEKNEVYLVPSSPWRRPDVSPWFLIRK